MRFRQGHELRLRRIYRQWQLGRPIDEPGVVRRGAHGEPEIEVLVQLAPGRAPPPPLTADDRRRQSGVVSATVQIKDLRLLAAEPSILRMEAARGLSRALHSSVTAIHADTASLAAAFSVRPPYDGRGVIIGILDDTCDIAHPNFIRDGSTRLLSLWRQRAGANPQPPAGYTFGTEYSASQINAALAAGDPYGPLMGNVSPGANSHGTSVMDIAAGNGSAPGSHAGVAPGADLIFVEVDAGDVGASDFVGNSARLWQAAEYVFKRAEQLRKPAVINISLGTNGGPHDGSALVDEQLETLLDRPGRAIVIAAGNAFGARCHAQGALAAGASRTLTWVVTPNDSTGNELEVWYSGGPLAVFLKAPGGRREHGPVTLSHAQAEFPLPDGSLIFVQHAIAANGAGHINVFLEEPPLAGNWSVRLQNPGPAAASYDAWIERDGGKATQSHFADGDADTSRTLGSLSCGGSSIVVGSYACGPVPAASEFSAAGTTRDGRQKPDLSAPGESQAGSGILAAQSKTKGLARFAGTSQAAPHVTGVIALMMQAAPGPLTIGEIRSALVTSSHSSTNGWDPRAGFGRLDAQGAISGVLP